MAFLTKKEIGYTNDSLSCGTRKLNKKDYEIYKNRILEMQKILKVKDETEKNQKTIDWLITCAENKITRYDGFRDLYIRSYFMAFHDEKINDFVPKNKLNPTQKQRLRNLFFSMKDAQNYDSIIETIIEKDDPKMLNFVTKQFKKLCCKNEENQHKSEFFIEIIVELSKRKELKEILDKINLLENDDEKEMKKLMKEFAQKL